MIATARTGTFTAARAAALLTAALLLILCATTAVPSRALGAESPPPAIGIIIDDLGNRPELDLRVVRLPGAVTCAFLPHTPHAPRLAGLADGLGKEVMLHLPMQALNAENLDAGMLRFGMSREEFMDTVRAGLMSLPHVRGVNNHMGSLLTQSPLRMQWLMDELKRHEDEDLYFVDSFTSLRSVAHAVAARNQLPTLRRDVFLDASRDPEIIRAQFELLLERARENGTAVAIAHPYPETVDFLESRLPRLHEEGIELLPMSSLILRRHALETAPAEPVLAAEVRRRQNIALIPGGAELRSQGVIREGPRR